VHAPKIDQLFITKFPKDPDEDKTLYFLGKSYFEIEQWVRAELAFMKIVTEYPKSGYYKEARSILDKGLTEKKQSSARKAKTKESKKKAEVAAPEPDRVALIKFEEEGKQPVSLKEEKFISKETEERIGSLTGMRESVKPIPPKEGVRVVSPSSMASFSRSSARERFWIIRLIRSVPTRSHCLSAIIFF
jgi:hypothetical protein